MKTKSNRMPDSSRSSRFCVPFLKWYRLLNQKGMSIIEMMIALIMMGIVTTSIFQLYIQQHKNYITQEDITEIQQNARASIDEIAKNVRMAGYEVPSMLAGIEGYDTNPDTIVLTYHASDCDNYLASAMPQPSAELKVALDPSCFYDGQWVYIYEPDSGGGEWFVITHVQPSAKHIQHNTMVLSKKYGVDAVLLGLDRVKFFVDNTTDPNHPNLMVEYIGQSPQVFAENITDLQIQYGMKGGAVVDEPTIPENIRQVKISLVARSGNPDVDIEGNDPYRYRTFTSAVHTRNMGIYSSK